MRVFSQINNCQQKNKNKNKQTNKQTKQKRRGGPLLGLAKSIYYPSKTSPDSVSLRKKKSDINLG